MRTLALLFLLSLSACDDLDREKRVIKSAEADCRLTLDVLRTEAEQRGATDFVPRLDAFQKKIDEGVAEMQGVVARGERSVAKATVARVARQLDEERAAVEREFEQWKKKARAARREAPFEVPAFLSEPGAVSRIEFPPGQYLDLEARADRLFELERWVSFCKSTGGQLALTAPTSNAVVVRYRPADDLEEKRREAVERKQDFSMRQLRSLLEAAGLSESDFVEIRLQPSYGASGPFEVEVVEPCVEKKKPKKP